MYNLVKRVQNTIFQHQLLERNSKILLAVSGGPDSVCLLDIFSKLQKKYDLKLAIAHVNYGLRGKDSDEDEKFVRKLAEKYGMGIFIDHPVETQNFASLPKRKMLPENQLRDIRYSFFEKIKKENNFDLIAVAHNLDDQVETYLMRIIRGAGLAGLTAMKPKNENIIRPMLFLPRDEILKYLKKNKLKFRLDRTNLESKYLRNKIRNELLPYLEKNFNPEIRKTIFDSTQSIVDDYDFLEEESKKLYGKNKELSVKKLMELHPAMQKRVLRLAILEAKSDLKNIDASHIEEIIKAAKSTKNKLQNVVLKGLKITRRGDKLKIDKITK